MPDLQSHVLDQDDLNLVQALLPSRVADGTPVSAAYWRLAAEIAVLRADQEAMRSAGATFRVEVATPDGRMASCAVHRKPGEGPPRVLVDWEVHAPDPARAVPDEGGVASGGDGHEVGRDNVHVMVR